MERITLMADGGIQAGRLVTAETVLRRLALPIQLEEGYLLRGFFRMIDRYPPLAQLSPFFQDFLETYRAEPEGGGPPAGLDYLEIGKTIEMIGFPGKPRLEVFTTLQGVFEGRAVEIKAWRLDKLLDTPLKLGGLRHVVFGDQVDVLEFETVFTLFEFIDATQWQLGFHGAPVTCAIRR
jgi:hypothetical protein